MRLITYAYQQAEKFYDKETYDHTVRVANYVMTNDMIPEDRRETCVALAIMHDLLEDTKYVPPSYGSQSAKEVGYTNYFDRCLNYLTNRGKRYTEYIKNIKVQSCDYPEIWWVKLADMKDHFMQKDTLTDALKEKYLEALPYLL